MYNGFEASRSKAYSLLGDAQDAICIGCKPSPTPRQRRAIESALKHIADAKAALNRAAGVTGA